MEEQKIKEMEKEIDMEMSKDFTSSKSDSSKTRNMLKVVKKIFGSSNLSKQNSTKRKPETDILTTETEEDEKDEVSE